MDKERETQVEVFHEYDGEITVEAVCHIHERIEDGKWRVDNVLYEVSFDVEDGASATVWLDRSGDCTSNEYDCGLAEAERNGRLAKALDDFHEQPGKDTIGSRAANAVDDYVRLLGENLNNVLVLMKNQCCAIPCVWAMRACEYSPVDNYDSDSSITVYNSIDDALRQEREILERPVDNSNAMWRRNMAELAIFELERLR